MKRILSILLVALLLLAALPTFAEEAATLQPGLYAAEDSLEVLYLDEQGCGIMNYYTGEIYSANGVLWTETSLQIERVDIPYAILGDAVIFTYGGAVRIFRYAGAGTDYALGDGNGTAFAGTYLAENGGKLVLNADGQGAFTGADGEKAIFWGSLQPYWRTLEGVTEAFCYVMLDGYLCGIQFADDQAAMTMENGDVVTFVRQAQTQPAGEGQIYYGYTMITDGQTVELIPLLTAMGMDPKGIYLELRPDGTGHIRIMDEDNASDFTWTEDAFTVDGESVPYTREGDHIVLNIEGEAIEFIPAAEFEALLGGADTETESQTTTETTTADANGLVGSWTFTKAKAMGMEIPASMMGTTMSIVLREDGTAVLTTDDSSNDLEWIVQDDGTVILSVAGTEVFTVIFDGTFLTLDTGAGVEMVFEKDM